MTRKLAAMSKTKTAPLYKRIREILESARATVARSVNSGLVMANWLIGGEIVVEQQHGSKRAGYGEGLLAELAGRLSKEFGKGWSERHLEYCPHVLSHLSEAARKEEIERGPFDFFSSEDRG